MHARAHTHTRTHKHAHRPQVVPAKRIRARQLLMAYWGRVLTNDADRTETSDDPTGAVGLKHAFTYGHCWARL